MAFLLPVVLIICFFSIDTAWMLLLRTQLRVATDAAARAAAAAARDDFLLRPTTPIIVGAEYEYEYE